MYRVLLYGAFIAEGQAEMFADMVAWAGKQHLGGCICWSVKVIEEFPSDQKQKFVRSRTYIDLLKCDKAVREIEAQRS